MNQAVDELRRRYLQVLRREGVEPTRRAEPPQSRTETLNHAAWMVETMLVDAWRDEWSERKVRRWLGFIQSALWTQGLRSISQLRDDSRHLYNYVQVAPLWRRSLRGEPPMSYMSQVTKVGPCEYVLPPVGKMGVEVRAFLSEALFAGTDEALWKQAAESASTPGAIGMYLMPDTHLGYHLPVGGVLVN